MYDLDNYTCPEQVKQHTAVLAQYGLTQAEADS